ncbi:unnamed protein product [Peronospora belbahrii]|uniref:Uncharacterized protein n=1 Tax=Peronospora belbahrii TaxID=622444 RepID=A0AAU9L9K6_9STRA|nr:unnamed protein product [Peronospora belbahrii]CAH0513470.1 unnamed protein product [Peronospora belbahrii]
MNVLTKKPPGIIDIVVVGSPCTVRQYVGKKSLKARAEVAMIIENQTKIQDEATVEDNESPLWRVTRNMGKKHISVSEVMVVTREDPRGYQDAMNSKDVEI